MDQGLETQMEVFRVAVRNRSTYFEALKPELRSYYAETKFWSSGASFHVCCGNGTLQYQLQPPQPSALNDWMLTVSILNGRLHEDGSFHRENPPSADNSKRYSPSIKDGVVGWVDFDSGDNFETSVQIADYWDGLFEAELLPQT